MYEFRQTTVFPPNRIRGRFLRFAHNIPQFLACNVFPLGKEEEEEEGGGYVARLRHVMQKKEFPRMR